MYNNVLIYKIGITMINTSISSKSAELLLINPSLKDSKPVTKKTQKIGYFCLTALLTISGGFVAKNFRHDQFSNTHSTSFPTVNSNFSILPDVKCNCSLTTNVSLNLESSPFEKYNFSTSDNNAFSNFNYTSHISFCEEKLNFSLPVSTIAPRNLKISTLALVPRIYGTTSNTFDQIENLSNKKISIRNIQIRDFIGKPSPSLSLTLHTKIFSASLMLRVNDIFTNTTISLFKNDTKDLNPILSCKNNSKFFAKVEENPNNLFCPGIKLQSAFPIFHTNNTMSPFNTMFLFPTTRIDIPAFFDVETSIIDSIIHSTYNIVSAKLFHETDKNLLANHNPSDTNDETLQDRLDRLRRDLDRLRRDLDPCIQFLSTDGIIRNFLFGNIVGRVTEQGLANLVNLATLRHGTNIVNWGLIHLFGTNPALGGQLSGGETQRELFHFQNIGRTYFAYPHARNLLGFNSNRADSLESLLSSKIIPQKYKFYANINLIHSKIDSSIASNAISIFSVPFSVLMTAIIPSIKIHILEDDIFSRNCDGTVLFRFDNSEMAAISTAKPFSALSIGVIGTIWHSFHITNTFSRMMQNPTRVLTGVVQLTTSAWALNAIIQNSDTSISLIAGLILGMT